MYHLGTCPICGEGLRGVRICCGQPIVVCDECDALWSSPRMSDRIPSSAEPDCPFCQRSLWGAHAHWASKLEVETADWWSDVAGELPPTDRVEVENLSLTAAGTPVLTGIDSWGTPVVVFGLLLVGSLVAVLAIL